MTDNTIPQLGYGVWQVEDGVAEKVVRQAFEAGFRHIDTAKIYGNEAGVGRAIERSGLSAEEIFITTKLWNADQGYESTLRPSKNPWSGWAWRRWTCT